MSVPTTEHNPTPAYQQSVDAVIAALRTDSRRGLSEAEARTRIAREGRNELTTDEPVPGWRKFLAQCRDVLVILLLIATASSAALWLVEREAALPYEAMAILAVVLLNAIMGHIQASRAESAVAALRKMSTDEAAVMRDDQRRNVPAAEIVRGDIILIEAGDTIPADARVIQSTALHSGSRADRRKPAGAERHRSPGRRSRTRRSPQHDLQRHGGHLRAQNSHSHNDRDAHRNGAHPGMLKEAPEETTPLQKELDRLG